MGGRRPIRRIRAGERLHLGEVLRGAVFVVVVPRKRARGLLAQVFASESGGVGRMTVRGQVRLQRPTQRLAPPITADNGERKLKEQFSYCLSMSSSITPGRINSFALVTGNLQSAWHGYPGNATNGYY